MAENVVTIKGNKYKYTYVDGETKYLGPVGDAPALTEQEFMKAIPQIVGMKKGQIDEDVLVSYIDSNNI